jgi:hypothetical protein
MKWIKYLAPIISDFKDGSDEPLDGDAVDVLVELIKANINLNEGNITQDEFNDLVFNSDENDDVFSLNENQINELKKMDWVVKQNGFHIQLYSNDFSSSDWEDVCKIIGCDSELASVKLMCVGFNQ